VKEKKKRNVREEKHALAALFGFGRGDLFRRPAELSANEKEENNLGVTPQGGSLNPLFGKKKETPSPERKKTASLCTSEKKQA